MHKKLKSVLSREPRAVRYEYAVVVCRVIDGEEVGSLTNRTDNESQHKAELEYWQAKIDRPNDNITEVHEVVRTIKTSKWSQMP